MIIQNWTIRFFWNTSDKWLGQYHIGTRRMRFYWLGPLFVFMLYKPAFPTRS